MTFEELINEVEKVGKAIENVANIEKVMTDAGNFVTEVETVVSQGQTFLTELKTYIDTAETLINEFKATTVTTPASVVTSAI
jgi:hypothetical protein